MEKKVILFDPGHGWNTPGKCSPDKSLIEWEYNREICRRLRDIFKEYGWDARLVVFEDYDVSLNDRVKRINKVCDKYGAGNVIMVSIHCNAAKNGQWADARGWSVWTTKGQNNSDKLADELFAAAQSYLPQHGMTLRKETYNDGDVDYEKNFTVIYGAKCPAVLTENLFMDNKIDCAWLLTEEGKETITNIHVDGILKYMEKYW